MSSFPQEKIEKLIAENNWEEVKNEISTWLKNSEEEEVGEQYLEAAKAYLDLMNKKDAEYLEKLKKMSAMLTKVSAKSDQLKDLGKIHKIINKVKEL